jgi:hypothetical protein
MQKQFAQFNAVNGTDITKVEDILRIRETAGSRTMGNKYKNSLRDSAIAVKDEEDAMSILENGIARQDATAAAAKRAADKVVRENIASNQQQQQLFQSNNAIQTAALLKQNQDAQTNDYNAVKLQGFAKMMQAKTEFNKLKADQEFNSAESLLKHLKRERVERTISKRDSGQPLSQREKGILGSAYRWQTNVPT